MKLFVSLGGLILYYLVGASIDAVFPAADLLGFNFQGLVLSSLSMIAALWIAVRLELF